MSLALGSYWGLIPAIFMILGFVWRLFDEGGWIIVIPCQPESSQVKVHPCVWPGEIVIPLPPGKIVDTLCPPSICADGPKMSASAPPKRVCILIRSRPNRRDLGHAAQENLPLTRRHRDRAQREARPQTRSQELHCFHRHQPLFRRGFACAFADTYHLRQRSQHEYAKPPATTPAEMPKPSPDSQAPIAPIIPPTVMLASNQKIQLAKFRTTAIRPPGREAAQTRAKW